VERAEELRHKSDGRSWALEVEVLLAVSWLAGGKSGHARAMLASCAFTFSRRISSFSARRWAGVTPALMSRRAI
jgi:hypothetical protein